jgi:centromere protein J
MVAANANAERREHRNALFATTFHNDFPSEADTSELMGDTDAVLSVTPNKGALDLSAYLVPAIDDDETLSMLKEVPASLDTQKHISMDEDSREISNLMDYLNDLDFDSPGSLLESHSKHQTPTASRLVRSTARTPVTKNRALMQTPRSSVLRERTNQTWPAKKKETEQEHGPPTDKRHLIFSSSPFVTQSDQESEPLPEHDHNEDIHENARFDKSFELDLDASLEALLEETANSIMTPKKTWKFTEEEWQRLEKVQQMAEVLLREAEHERESTRRWARSVHESVRLWVDEQTNSNTSANAQLKVTRDALSRLKLELQAAENHHTVVKEKLLAIIQRQADTIKSLEAKLRASHNSEISAPTFKSPPRPVVSSTSTLSPFASMRASRISLSPTVQQSRRDKQLERDAPSPISAIDPITPTKHDALPQLIPSPISMSVTPRTQRARTTLVDGGKLVVYQNGTEKEMRPDGTCIIRFPNGDVKCTLGGESAVGIVAYYHAKEKTTHIRHKSGVEIFEYPNGQVERNFPDGSKDVRFADGTKRTMLPDGSKETLFADGVRVKEDSNGKREITGKPAK